MADPVSIVSSVAQVLSTCISLCQTTSHLVEQIQNAPKHVSAIASDLQAFYTLLSTIQAYLNDEETRSGLLHPTTSSDIQEVLKNTLSVFQSFHHLVNEYMTAAGNGTIHTWQRVKWTWKEKEVLQLRDQLNAHKMTLSVAIATANLINTTRTNASTARIEQEVQDLKHTLTQLLTRLDQDRELATEAAVVVLNYETTVRRIANDAASVLSSVNPNEDPELSFNIDRVVSTLATRSTFETAPVSQTHEASNPSPDLEYTGSFYKLSMRFHGTPDQVQHMKKQFQQRAAGATTKDLAVLCQTLLQELTNEDSPGARLDFYFYQDMYDLPRLRDFLHDHVGFALPDGYEVGDFAALSPRWVFWLHSLAETTYSGVTKTSMSENDSNRWRMTFMRRLDDMEPSISKSEVILHRPQEKMKDARLPDVYGYSTHWKMLRDQFDARKRDSPHSDDSPRALTSEA